MISLELNIDNKKRTITIHENLLFNTELINHPYLIKKLIKQIDKSYVIKESFFEILNNYVEIDENGVSLYGGLIVRTNIDNYAVLYLEKSNLDDDYIIKVINEYIFDIADHDPKEINIDKFEIDIKTFLKIK